MKRTELRLPDEVYEHYRNLAFQQKTSLNQELVKALENEAARIKFSTPPAPDKGDGHE